MQGQLLKRPWLSAAVCIPGFTGPSRLGSGDDERHLEVQGMLTRPESVCNASEKAFDLQMKANLLVKLASKTDTLGDRLMQLKLIFPRANVSLMVSRAPALALMEDLDPIRQGAAAFREMLPTADLDM